MPAVTKQEADAYDRMIDAAAELAYLIESSHIEIDEYALEKLTIYLASHAREVRNIFGGLKRKWPCD
jgi:dsDNA-binding SOS-regulon protein